MCFRFQQNGRGDNMSKEELQVIADFLGIKLGIEELPKAFQPASNIALTDHALVVTNEAPRRAEMQRFSIIPYGSKDPKKVSPNLYGNATREKVASSPVWKGLFQRRRCLIPVSGFYDWVTKEDGKTKVPYLGYVRGESMFCLAGIWERWIDPTDSSEVRSFAIITSPPNELWSKVHNRMPVILNESSYEQWLDPSENLDLDILHKLLNVFPAERMAIREFSRAVNSSKNKDEATLVPVGEPR
jgi:putative SOS response-associated peptidase YedK